MFPNCVECLSVHSSNNCIIYVIFKYLLFLSYKTARPASERGQYSDVLFNEQQAKWASFILLEEGRSHNAGQATEPSKATEPGLGKPGSSANKRKNPKS